MENNIQWQNITIGKEFRMKIFEENSFLDNSIIEGLTTELSVFYVLEYFKRTHQSIIIVTSNLFDANKLFRSFETYSDRVFLFPMDDFLTSIALAVSPELKVKRLETLDKIKQAPSIVITNMMGYLKFLPQKSIQDDLKIELKVGMNISREKLVESFEKLGYHRDSMVTSTGEYAVRGFVLDIFLVQQEKPIRIEFFGSEIESIRYFDGETQRTIEGISTILCHPIDEIVTENASSLLDYLENATTMFVDYPQITASYQKLIEEATLYNQEQHSVDKHFWYLEDLVPSSTIYIHTFTNELHKKNVFHYTTSEIENFKGNFEKLKEKVMGYIFQNKTVLFVLSTKNQVNEIKDLFEGNVKILKNYEVQEKMINIYQGKLNKGFVWDNFVVISEYDIEEIKTEITYKNNLHIGKKIQALDALQTGDYVVHRNHGIGVYCGVVTLETQGIKKDYIQISYLGNDKVYIPVEKISTIYKYSDKDGMKPQINKLGSTNWARKKQSIQKKIRDISSELVKLYAKRNSVVGDAFKDYPEEDLFAQEFMYEPTRDQSRAIDDILNDLSSKVPMDRLLCGDVGFGKTEVAFRAMFKTILNNKQVLYLCPTTILSKQQYQSAMSRFKSYPLEIRLFNRFTSSKEANEIIEGLKNGKIDIVFGTHRLLNDAVVPKNLGLLVIDEEQRFGVTHKEKIKKLKSDVNVLTLSATPIPRTLKMSLSGLRDLSIIDTPPINRYPIQTYVVQDSDLLVRDAVYKELAREGQIFVLYNRVETIEEKMNYLQKLVPEARIRYAHGQMTKTELDDIMTSFIEHEFDILVSTTIIETGIDIPNANTLIIYDADRFGLSQLYQLRGRVGRSERIAYAYLLYNKTKMLNDVAVKRLQAIRNFTELGSGYKIAMRDLSIRGAGDLLGSEQAGFVDTVGISLYMKMIEEEMKRLRGEYVDEEDGNDSIINVDTHIEDSYVSDESVKIEIHKMINDIDSFAKLENVKENLIDRFGNITPTIEIYMYEEWFEKLAYQLHIQKVKQNPRIIEITIPEIISSQIKGDKLFLEAYSIHPKFQLKYVNKEIIISLPLLHLEKHFVYYVVPLFQKIYDDLEV